ncbi:MAG: hypothetical protein ACI9MC_002439 [Kiritimatiellia bacterium]|jgi:hypothetical protein
MRAWIWIGAVGLSLGTMVIGACSNGDDFIYIPDEHTDVDNPNVGIAVVDPDQVHIVDVQFDDLKTAVVRLINQGEYSLQLETASFPEDQDGRGALYTDEGANGHRKLSPGDNYDIIIACAIKNEPLDQRVGTLVIITDDRANERIDVPVTCTPTGWTGETDETDIVETDETDETDGT